MPKILNNDPSIITHENFLNFDLCDYFIRKFSDRLDVSFVTDGNEALVSQARQSTHTFINKEDQSGREVIDLVCNYHGWNKDSTEKIQFLKYEVGQGYAAHYDAFDVTDIDENPNLRGQRIITNIIYLNDGFSGGETTFPRLSIGVKPRKGTLLAFHNCFANSCYLNPLSEHSSAKILTGTKYIITIWLTRDCI